MKLDIKQQPYNTTRMGVLKGVLDHFGSGASAARAFGGSGHAFVINIHKQICPSGPYCWNGEPFGKLARNLGIEIRDLGFFHADTPLAERIAVEEKLRSLLDRGVPCSMVNMEYQLITGYDETGFDTARPWECDSGFPPARLTFESWNELGNGIHLGFSAYYPLECSPIQRIAHDSLLYAIDLHRNPANHSWADYGIGPNAYANWFEAVKAGHGNSHGNWWNATVWAECRKRASEYLLELLGYGVLTNDVDACAVAHIYSTIGHLLERCADKEMSANEKMNLLAEAARYEAAVVPKLEEMVAELA